MRFNPQSDQIVRERGYEPAAGRRGDSPVSRTLMLLLMALLVGMGAGLWTVHGPRVVQADEGPRPIPRILIVAAPEPPAARVDDGAEIDSVDPLDRPETTREDRLRSRNIYRRARSFQQLGRYHDALPYLEQAVELDPENAVARYSLGIAYAQLGNLDAARAQRTALADLDPNMANLLGALVR